MSARDDIAAHFTSDTLVDQLLGAHRAEVLAEYANPASAHTIYAERSCSCDETPHPTWCPASIPTDERINEIRQGTGEPLTPRELAWLRGTADRHELHVIAARDGHWPLTEDLAGALLLVSQYLAAAVAVIDRAEQIGEKASATAPTATPQFFQPGRTYTEPGDTTDWRFRCDAITTHPADGDRTALGWRHFRGEWSECAYDEDDFEIHRIADDIANQGDSK